MSGQHFYDCSHCAENPYFYDALGHSGRPQQFYTKHLITGEDLEICPMMTILRGDKKTLEEVRMHRDELYPLYRAGHLPVGGGVLDQPARSLAMFRYFDYVASAGQRAFDKIRPPGGEPVIDE